MQPSSPQVPDPGLPPVPQPPVPAPAQPPAMPAGPSVPAPAVPAADAGATPELADDGDLIEKEWIHKVKQVMAATANDPYEQNKQFTAVKTDYMQKRYGKTIKSDD